MSEDFRPDDVLAAEYVLGLLEGEDLFAARAREASDEKFAAEVARWQDQLAPLLDTIDARTPREEVWKRIRDEFDTLGDSAEIISLNARLRRWKMAAGTAAAAAIAAISVLVLSPSQSPSPVPAAEPQAPLAASIPIADTQLRLAVTYLPDRQELLVSASGLTADGVHDHELWLVPRSEDMPLLSLGVVAPGEERRISLDQAVAEQMADGSPLLLTREPLGGKPPGIDAGPVVAEGRMQTI